VTKIVSAQYRSVTDERIVREREREREREADGLQQRRPSSESTTSICCGFAVQQAVQQVRNKSTTDRKSTSDPQHLDMLEAFEVWWDI